MENTTDDNSSERDKKMMGSFELFADKEDSKEKKKKSKDKKTPSIFEAALKEEEKPEKRGSIFEDKKPEKGQDKKERVEDKDIEKLDKDEVRVVAEKYLDAQKESLKEELEQTEPDSTEEAQVLADAAFIETLSEKLENDEIDDENILDSAMAETIDELEIDEDDALEIENIGEDAPEVDPDELDDTPEDDDTTAIPTTQATPKPVIPPPVVSAAAPPIPPAPPVVPRFGGGGIPPIPPIGPNMNPNIPSHSPNIVPASPNVLQDRHNRGADLLVGGVIGYLIGRRRGRIRTEEKMIPVQEKLEKQVKDLHGQIAERETKIRELVSKRVEQAPEANRVAVTERLVQRIEKRSEQKVENARDDVRAEAIEDEIESPFIVPVPNRAERLASVLIPRPETAAVRPEVYARPESGTEIKPDIQTATVPELLKIANKMEIQGVTVGTMYETGRIDAVGMKRLVGEYLQGNRYEYMLPSLLKSEKSPEILSDFKSPSESAASAGGGGGGWLPDSNRPENKLTASQDTTKKEPVYTPSEKSHAKNQQNKTLAFVVVLGIMIALLLVGILL